MFCSAICDVSENKKCPLWALFNSWLGRTQFPRHKCLRGIPNDLIALCLSNLLIVEPATDVADYEPWPQNTKIKPAQCRLNSWLGRTDSNHDKENQNLLSYH